MVSILDDADLSLSKPLSMGRQVFTYVMNGLAFALAGLAILPLFSILYEIVRQGAANLSLDLFTSLPAAMGEQGVTSGFGNAIQGTIYMVALASVFSIPIGVLTAIFLSEFGKGSKAASAVRFILTVLSGVPSIVVGAFAYGVIVLGTITGYKGFSALAGSFALSVIMLPIVALATEEALKLVPTPLRLASSALGGNRFHTTFKVVIATALPGITTGVLLAVARAAGETAPLIFTSLFSQSWFSGWLEPAASMSVLIYNYAQSPFEEQNKVAWTASLVLLALVLLTNILSRLATRKRKAR